LEIGKQAMKNHHIENIKERPETPSGKGRPNADICVKQKSNAARVTKPLEYQNHQFSQAVR